MSPFPTFLLLSVKKFCILTLYLKVENGLKRLDCFISSSNFKCLRTTYAGKQQSVDACSLTTNTKLRERTIQFIGRIIAKQELCLSHEIQQNVKRQEQIQWRQNTGVVDFRVRTFSVQWALSSCTSSQFTSLSLSVQRSPWQALECFWDCWP